MMIDETFFASAEYKNADDAERRQYRAMFHAHETLDQIHNTTARALGYGETDPMYKILVSEIADLRKMHAEFTAAIVA